MLIQHFYDAETATLSYVLADEEAKACAIIDSLLDFDSKAGRTSTRSADALTDYIVERGWSVQWILETHAHADHLSAAPYLKTKLGGQTAIGAHITDVQKVFGELFNAGEGFATDGRQFDRLLNEGESLHIGGIAVSVMHTPGHTPACCAYVATQGEQIAAFVGDTLFMPDFGTARCDFPGGDASVLYRSIQRLLSLPPHAVLYMCHDYLPGGRALQFSCTVDEARQFNIHVHDGVTETQFVALRTARDKTLSVPTLLLQSVQVNMRAGELPPVESNGIRYLKIPLDAL